MMTVKQFLAVMLARKRLLLSTTLVVLLLVGAVTLVLPKRYVSEAVISVDGGEDPSSLALVNGSMIQQNYLGTQIAIISSHTTALQVVRSLKMASLPQAQQNFAASGAAGDIEDWLATGLLRGLEVEVGKDSSVITVRYTAVSPEFASTIANAFVDAYRRVVISTKSGKALQSESFFKDQMVSLQRELENRQSELSVYQQQHGVLASSERVDMENQRLMELTAEVTRAQTDYIAASSLLAGAHTNTTNNPLVAQLTLSLADLQKQRSMLLAKAGSQHPLYQQLTAQIAETQRQLAQQQNHVIEQTQQTVTAMDSRLKAQQEELAQQKQRVLQLKDQQTQLDILQRGVDNAQRNYDLVMQRWSESAIQSNASFTNITVLQRAQIPTQPIFPKPLFNMVFGLLLGVATGAFVSFLAEMRRRRLRCDDDIIHTLGLPVLVTLQGEALPAPQRLLLGWRGGQS